MADESNISPLKKKIEKEKRREGEKSKVHRKKNAQLKLLRVDFVRCSMLSCPQLFGCCCFSFQNRHFFSSIYSCHLVLFFFIGFFLLSFMQIWAFFVFPANTHTHTQTQSKCNTHANLSSQKFKKILHFSFFLLVKHHFLFVFSRYHGRACSAPSGHDTPQRRGGADTHGCPALTRCPHRGRGGAGRAATDHACHLGFAGARSREPASQQVLLCLSQEKALWRK